jgi:hypothetical protein
MTQEYNSFEQRVWDSIKPVREFTGTVAKYGGKALYGTIATPMRLPTFLRRTLEKDNLSQREIPKGMDNNTSEDLAKTLGFSLGMSIGLTSLAVGAIYLIRTAVDGDYNPAIATSITLGATNFLSGMTEVVRSDKKIRNLERDLEEQRSLKE